MKRLGLGKLYRDALDDLRLQRGPIILPASWVDNFAAVPRPGRARRSPAFYALWARRYVAACQSHPDAPVKSLARVHTSTPDASSEATIRGFLHKARNYSPPILTESPSGRSGGELRLRP